MHIILGVTGHVGSVVAEELLKKGEDVTVVVRDENKGTRWKEKGAQVALADVKDVASLHEAFQRGEWLFLMLPPGDVGGDALQEEYDILNNYHAALIDSGIKKIVGLSSIGANLWDNAGNLLSSSRMEHQFNDLPLKKSFLRPAYYFSNWDASLQTAREQGVVNTFYPPDLKIPMVAPRDNGELIAKLMLDPIESEVTVNIEGPEHYSSADVATAFSQSLGKEVKAVEASPESWVQALKAMGFSSNSAAEFIEMTQSVLDGRAQAEAGTPIYKGTISLQLYINDLVKA